MFITILLGNIDNVAFVYYYYVLTLTKISIHNMFHNTFIRCYNSQLMHVEILIVTVYCLILRENEHIND